MKNRFLLLLVIALMSVMPTWAQTTNLTEGCVAEYDATTDYFPEKATVDFATGFTVEYYNNYKVVNVLAPFPGAKPEDGFQYVLVQCGTPTPDGYDDAEIIEIPTGKVISLSTTFLPHLVDLGLLDQLIGVDSFLYINTSAVLDKIAKGDVLEVGSGSTINVESVLASAPSLVLANASGSPEYDAHPVLLDAGIPVAISADYVENTPLGQAEWIKFTALFYNQDGLAQDIFAERANAYQNMVNLTQDIAPQDRPVVLWDAYSSYSNAWFVPGSDTYVAQILSDAGATYVLSDAPDVQGKNGSVPLDFEVVYEAGIHADYWLINSFTASTLADLIASDERYSDFDAYKSNKVYSNGARVNANGGNDYYESGISNPQLILADLITVIHPDLVPSDGFTYLLHLP